MKFLYSGLGNSLLSFIILYLITSWLNSFASSPIDTKTQTYSLILLSITLSLSAFMFSSRLKYYRNLLLLALICFSPIILVYITKLTALAHLLSATILFNLALTNLLLLLLALIPWPKIKLGIGLIFAFIAIAPSAIFFLYYTIYHVIFTVDGLIAILQTNGTEALSFIHDYAHLSTVITLIISLALCYLTARKLLTLPTPATYKSPIIILIAASIFIMLLNRSTLITNPYIDFYDLQQKYGEFIANANTRYQLIKENLSDADANAPGIYVLVIGESHNKLYTTPYNYKVNSTPWLESMQNNPNFIMFTDAYSCFPQTVQALSYALTLKNQYNDIPLPQAPSILEVAKAAGYKTVWLSNQGKFGIFDTGITLIAKEADYSHWLSSKEGGLSTYVNLSTHDGELLPLLKQIKPAKRMLIVIHLYGSHGTYKDRFPKEFAKFHGLHDQVVDDYVNSVYYNDYVMHEIFNYVKALPNFKALFYFSDHAEAVDKGGHSAANYKPDMIAIPMYMYFSDSYIKENPQEFKNLKAASHFAYTNDLTANTLFSIMNLRLGAYYEPQNDLGNPEYDHHFERFKTLYGKVNLTDWHELSALR